MKEKLEQWFINSAIKDFESGMTMFWIFYLYSGLLYINIGLLLSLLILVIMTLLGLKYHYFGRDLYDASLYLLIKDNESRNKQRTRKGI